MKIYREKQLEALMYSTSHKLYWILIKNRRIGTTKGHRDLKCAVQSLPSSFWRNFNATLSSKETGRQKRAVQTQIRWVSVQQPH